MIRQAISCDICGAEKKQTNHWFVAWELAEELRVSGWSSRNRLRAGSKHLCGQACLHKLADEFMARVIARKSAAKPQSEEGNELEADSGAIPAASHTGARGTGVDTSLTALSASTPSASFDEFESSARLLTPPTPAIPMIAPKPAAGLVSMRERTGIESAVALPDEPPRFGPRSARADAWERERERERGGRAGKQRPEIISRRVSQA